MINIFPFKLESSNLAHNYIYIQNGSNFFLKWWNYLKLNIF